MQNGGSVIGGGPITSCRSTLSSSSLYIVAARRRPSGLTEKPVSAMPSGSKIRSANTSAKRLALDPRQRDTEYVGGVAVGEPVAGLMRQRQLCQLGEPAVLILAQRQPAVCRTQWRRHGEHVGQPAAVRHQILDRDGPAGRPVLSSGPSGSISTRMSASSGSHFATGSVSDSLPSSTKAIAAATVTGLVIEAMRKTVSRCIGSRRRHRGSPAR